MVVNTGKYQIDYKVRNTHTEKLVPTILDIGCGYGGLMFALTKLFPNNLILGQEIRDKVANFVSEKANTIRINSGYTECQNVSVVRTNTMKTVHNYFEKESVEKMFICFADPHFKRVNHRRRIIS
jgi:tRNA (guanine-N7-)-methyltransferase